MVERAEGVEEGREGVGVGGLRDYPRNSILDRGVARANKVRGAENVEWRVFDFQDRSYTEGMCVVVTSVGFASDYHLCPVSYDSQLVGCAINNLIKPE